MAASWQLPFFFSFFFLKGHYQQTSVTLMHCKEWLLSGGFNTELSDCLASSGCGSVHMQCLSKWRLIMSSAAEGLQTDVSFLPHSTADNIGSSVRSRMTHFHFLFSLGKDVFRTVFGRGRCTESWEHQHCVSSMFNNPVCFFHCQSETILSIRDRKCGLVKMCLWCLFFSLLMLSTKNDPKAIE